MEYEIGADESVCAAVVRAVCAIQGREPCSIRPLAEVLDPDAIGALFAVRADGTPRPGGHLSFVYGGCRIEIDNGEYLTVEPIHRDHRNPGPPPGESR